MTKFRIVGLLSLVSLVVGCADDNNISGPSTDSETVCKTAYPPASLRGWKEGQFSEVWAVPGVTMLAINEAQGCLVVGVKDKTVFAPVELKLSLIGIPRDAVYIIIFNGQAL